MRTREEALDYGLSFPDTYQDAPFHDENWQLARYKGNKKAFLWTYERDIVLYSGNQIVIFYGSDSWAYTRLGHVDMTKEELTKLLGNKRCGDCYRKI